jgi:2-oxo-4-hydroxy-4-carboxy-5-ureidoimidazoline decarboxylase
MAASPGCGCSAAHDRDEAAETAEIAEKKRLFSAVFAVSPVKQHMRLAALNALDDGAAVGAFLRCCGSSRWARQMSAARPFADAAAMAAAADRIASALEPADWREAFAAHPKIGAGRAGGAGGGAEAGWSEQEQAGVTLATDETLTRLADANRTYEARFGYIFIVCATGKTADEMLALLERRLRHDAGDELRIAAGEQRQITRLRLTKLIEQERDSSP